MGKRLLDLTQGAPGQRAHLHQNDGERRGVPDVAHCACGECRQQFLFFLSDFDPRQRRIEHKGRADQFPDEPGLRLPCTS